MNSWKDFSRLMWELGVEMDCYHSTPYNCECKRKDTEKQLQDCLEDAISDIKEEAESNGDYIHLESVTDYLLFDQILSKNGQKETTQ